MIKRIAVMIWMAGAVAQASEVPRKLTICVLVKTVDRPLIRSPAQGLASEMFAHIGISLEWKTWKPADESSQTSIII